jgi:hypothetical protein
LGKKSKIQQYYIYKFTTDRLKDSNYNITINPHKARKNGELISLGESQMLRSLRKIKGVQYTQDEIDQLFYEKKEIKTGISTPETIIELRKLEKDIDSLLFIPEIVSVVVSDVRHYEHIIQHGLFINNRRFARLMCSAGQMRRNTVLFVDQEYEEELKYVLNNDHKDIEVNPSKFNAYFALSSSTALPVSSPSFTVIPDLEIEREETVEFIEEMPDGNDKISVQTRKIPFNLFDGQGLISPRRAKKWAKDLGLDYLPSAFIVRSNFVKGLVVVFDFEKFSKEKGVNRVADIYGNSVNILDMDVILTKSQFKLAEGFDSVTDYIEKSEKNDLGWWVSRYSPREENKYTFTNYQFLQALDLDEDDISDLCSKTLDYFNNTMKNELSYALLYLLGKNCNYENAEENIFDRINDTITKALILNNDLIKDPYIQSHIESRLGRRIKESYIGKLLVDGFYTFAISDPYALAEHALGLSVHGLLERGQHYNKFYADQSSKSVVSMRAPLTWRSEVNSMSITHNKNIDKWYKYIETGAIFNIHGLDCMLMADSDFDGDIVCLTDEPSIVNNIYGGLPIYYETQKTPKKQIVEEELYQYDIKGFNPKIGFLTNCSTTMYAMLPQYDKNSKEYEEVIRRLKQCRKEQGSIIDSAKGLVVRPIPQHWTRWSHIDEEEMTEEELQEAHFYNKIMVDKRPIFMIYLYDNYYRDHREFGYNYNIYSIANFGKTLEEVLAIDKSSLTEDEKAFLNEYYDFNPFLETNCTINNISQYMQENVKKIKHGRKSIKVEKNTRILRDADVSLDRNKLKKLYNLYKKYKSEKRNFFNIKGSSGEALYKTLEQYNKAIRYEAYSGISSSITELANLAVTICYEMHPGDNKSFAWNVFGEGIVNNVYKNRQEIIRVPVLDNDHGNIEYLGSHYSMMEVDMEKVGLGGNDYVDIL